MTVSGCRRSATAIACRLTGLTDTRVDSRGGTQAIAYPISMHYEADSQFACAIVSSRSNVCETMLLSNYDRAVLDPPSSAWLAGSSGLSEERVDDHGMRRGAYPC